MSAQILDYFEGSNRIIEKRIKCSKDKALSIKENHLRALLDRSTSFILSSLNEVLKPAHRKHTDFIYLFNISKQIKSRGKEIELNMNEGEMNENIHL
jgi:hypothetical protein